MHEDSWRLDHHSRLLNALTHLLAIQALDVRGALNQVTELVADLLHADKVDVFLFDQAKNLLNAVGTSSTPMGRRQHEIGMERLPLVNGGRTVEVFVRGIAYQDGHVEDDDEELLGVRQGLGVRSTIIAPLVVNGVRRGVLQAVSAQPEFFSSADLQFLEAVAEWVGVVTHRAELVEQGTRDAALRERQIVADELITTLAHDLRNYLTPLVGRLSLLQTRAQSDKRQRDLRDLQMAMQVVERLERLVSDLLDVSRLDRGLFACEPEIVDLGVLVRQTAAVLNSPEFVVEVHEPDEQVFLEIDPSRIRQALENVLSNARKYSSAGSTVVVRLEREERDDNCWVLLTIHDQGPGIPPEILPRLFQRFVRGHGSNGLGLGLYLTRGIVEAHGGSVTVDSVVGAGTIFRIALPAEPQSSALNSVAITG